MLTRNGRRPPSSRGVGGGGAAAAGPGAAPARVRSSGMSPATKVPAPTRPSMYPSWSSCSKAFTAGSREISSSSASARVEGSRWPGRSRPVSIAVR